MIHRLPVLFFLLISNLAIAQWDDTDRLSKAFHAGRRDALREKMPAKSMADFFSNPIRNRANDVDYQYSQDPDFYYLTGYLEHNSMLLVFKEEQLHSDQKVQEVYLGTVTEVAAHV